MTDEADKAGRFRQSVTAALLAALLCKSASAQPQTITRRPGGKPKRGPNKWLLRIFRGYDAGGRPRGEKKSAKKSKRGAK